MTIAATFDADVLGDLYRRAREAEDAGDLLTATQLFRECLDMDPDDHCGVAMRLAVFGCARPDRAPPAYVTTLFDQNAETFDSVLVEQLSYHVPKLARRLAAGHIPVAARILDLGCGTGLAGEAFADVAGEIVGVDLAEGMLEQADLRDVYADLYVGEAVQFLDEWDEAPFDVIIATDVWPYLGDLGPFITAAAKCLVPGGILIASTERAAVAETVAVSAFTDGSDAAWAEPSPADLKHGPVGWRVTFTQRFAHAVPYVTARLGEAGFDVVAVEPVTVRIEEGEPVAGDVFLALLGG